MRITLVNQYYPPDLAPTAALCAGLARGLAAAGHEVTVLASQGGYAGPKGAVSREAEADEGGVRVVRFRTPAFGKRRLLGRLLDYSGYFLRTVWRLWSCPRQDVVVCLTTPPFIGWAGLLHRLRHRDSRLVLWNMDCYPEAAEISGYLRAGGLPSRCLRWVAGQIVRGADRVVCLDRAMTDLLRRNYETPARQLPIEIVPNWEPASLFPAPEGGPSGRESSHAEVPLTVLYQGNAGMGHEFQTIVAAAERLRDKPVAFRFVGGGRWWSWLQEQGPSRGLPRWSVGGYVPKDQVPGLLADADVTLITLRPEAGGVMSPSKLHSCLAAGRPVLYVGPPGSNIDDCLARYECGGSFRNGDVAGVAGFLEGLGRDRRQRLRMGREARRAFETDYTDARRIPELMQIVTGGQPVGGTLTHRTAAESGERRSLPRAA